MNNPILIALAFVMFPAYGRTRDIIFESQIFEEYSLSPYKATLISILNFSSLVNLVWAPLLLAFLINKTALVTGQALFGICILLITIPAFVSYGFFTKNRKVSAAV